MCAYHEVQSLSHRCKLMHSHPGHECWEKMSEQLLNWDSRVAAACCYSSGVQTGLNLQILTWKSWSFRNPASYWIALEIKNLIWECWPCKSHPVLELLCLLLSENMTAFGYGDISPVRVSIYGSETRTVLLHAHWEPSSHSSVCLHFVQFC